MHLALAKLLDNAALQALLHTMIKRNGSSRFRLEINISTIPPAPAGGLLVNDDLDILADLQNQMDHVLHKKRCIKYIQDRTYASVSSYSGCCPTTTKLVRNGNTRTFNES